MVAVTLLIALGVRVSRLSDDLKRLIAIGLALRVVGALLRYEVLFRFYGGIGDAVGYFHTGVRYSSALYRLDPSIFASTEWWGNQWWGTQFVRWVSGFVIALIGPTMRGEFLFFSLLSFCGLLLFGVAFANAYPHLRQERYLRWLWLLPSLWFWPSSVGKDALVLLSLGLVSAGYVGRGGRPRWLLLLAGLALSTAIRPHVSAAIVIVLAAAQWLSAGHKLTFGRVVQAVALLVLALVGVQQSLGQLGLAGADLEGIHEFAQFRSGLTQTGGSTVSTGSGILGVPMAVINVLFRPFILEAHNLPALLTAFELTFFWLFVLRRRHRVAFALRWWRWDRFLRFALLMSAFYTLMLGLVVGNLGIIARQRVVILPLLLLLLEALPFEGVRRARESRLAWEQRRARAGPRERGRA